MATKLGKVYYDPSRPGAFGGIGSLQRSTHLGTKDIKEWLQHQDTYTLHKPVRHRFQRRVTITGGINQQLQIDLIDMRALRQHNNGFSYLVTAIDVFSKYAWAIPIKQKTGKQLVDAVSKIFAERTPINLQTDKGSEFVNKTFLKFLKGRGVHFFTTENEDIKAAVVERLNRTIKEKMWRYFTKTNALRYVDVIDKLIHNYNYSFHRSIGMTPAQVTTGNQEIVWQRLYGAPPEPERAKKALNSGDRVRVAQGRKTFKKGYTGAWTEELFTISRVNNTNPVTYIVKDDSGVEIKGSFYKQELQKVGDKTVYRIKRVIDERRGIGGRTEYLVSWWGYNSSFNSWVSSITSYID